MTLRDPRFGDLVTFICHVQPELDEAAARRILMLDPVIREGIAEAYADHRERAESLLELHLNLEGIEA